MADSGKRKREDSDETESEVARAKRESLPESRLSNSTLRSEEEDEYRDNEELKTLLVTLPPVQQWSPTTVGDLKSAVRNKHPGAEWREESEWTRRLIDAILAPNEGWDWQRLKSCSDEDYFTLPIHTIRLLNALFHINSLDVVRARTAASQYDTPLNLSPVSSGTIGYPIFRVDYTSDEEFELYKTCWAQFLEREFYEPRALSRDDITWFWVEDKEVLDGKGPREVRQLFQRLSATTFPRGLQSLWLCLMVDRDAITSMLRVYGPPAMQITSFIPSRPRRTEIPYLPYFSAVSTRWKETHRRNGRIGSGSRGQGRQQPEVDDGEYRGHFKCALRSVFTLWQNEQVQSPNEYYPRDRKIWGDIALVYEAPT